MGTLRLKDITKEQLEDLYLNKQKSLNSISKILKHSMCSIKRWLYYYKIPIRSRAESMSLLVSDKNPAWNGGEHITPLGYKKVTAKGHPRANSGYVFEHILVWEKANNKYLSKEFVIHHFNGIKADNRIENLVALKRGLHIDLAEPYKRRIRELEEEIKKLKDIKPVIS